jgi:hypothetical protein
MNALANLNKSVALCDGRDKYFKLAQNSARYCGILLLSFVLSFRSNAPPHPSSRLVHFILTKLVVDPKKQIMISMALMDSSIGSGRQLLRFFKEFREFQVIMGQLAGKSIVASLSDLLSASNTLRSKENRLS